MKTMTSIKQVSLLVAVLALALAMVHIASANDISIEVNGVDASSGEVFASFTGNSLPVKVIFSADQNASDVRVKAWITGQKDYSAVTERFDVIADKVYSKTLAIQTPSDLNMLSKDASLYVVVESSQGILSAENVKLTMQRESYNLEVLDVIADTQVKAGDTLPVTVVVKNRGSHFAEDNFVNVKIPALGLEERAYFGDISSVDQSDPDKEDAVEGRVVLRIPSNTPANIYTIEVEAANADSSAKATKKVAVMSSTEDTVVISSAESKTFAPGEKATYSITLVNPGNKVQIYNLAVSAPTELSVDLSDQVVVVPAGQSKAVSMDVSAESAGKYTFTVNINSDKQLVKSESFTANVEGTKTTAGTSLTSNATILLTVVLAIVFVVLLVVLIVLLTRKPQKSEEFGESYY